MSTLNLTVWCMALGAIAAVALARTGDLLARPSASLARALGYHLSVFVLVLVLSGVLDHLTHPAARWLHAAQVLAGPWCVALASFWVQGWLGAGQRDRLMAATLRLSAFSLPLLALAILALPEGEQLAAAGALALGGGALTCWLTFRAWIIGDRLALVMAVGGLFMLPALAGLHSIAIGGTDWPPIAHAAVAVCAVLGNALTGRLLWVRERHVRRTRDSGSVPALDPVTRLHSSAALVQRLVQSQKRRRRTRHEGAMLAVTVFDADRIATLVGTRGLNEVWMTVAARIQRQVGVVNPVGRYWDRCFVALLESIPAAAWLRPLGLRLARQLRQPLEVTGRDGEPVRVQVDIGIGVVHLAPEHPEVEDVLDQAQRLAEAARGMRARTAIADPASGVPVAIEQVQWGRRRRRRQRGPAGGLALQRA